MLPIVERELRVRARQPRTFWLRISVALLSFIIVGLSLVLIPLSSNPANLGRFLFLFLAWPTFMLCLLEGIRTTADSLSEEKREGTLGLLFLTDLRSSDIVLGKLCASGLNSLCALIAVFPALGFPLMLGGVDLPEIFRLLLTLVSTLLLSLGAGLLVSAKVTELMRAWLSTLAILSLMIVGLPLLQLWFPSMTRWLPIHWLSPSIAMLTLSNATYEQQPLQFWIPVVCSFLLAIVAVGIAIVKLPYWWSEKPRTAEPTKRKTVDYSRERDRSLLDKAPMHWLGARRGQEWRWLPWFVLIATVSWIVAAAFAPLGSTLVITLAITAFVVHGCLTLWHALHAIGVGASLRSSGAIELLYVTPLTFQEIVLGLAHGTGRHSRATALILCLGELTGLLIFGWRNVTANPSSLGETVFGILVACFVMLSCALDMWAAGWMGLYQGFSQPKRSTAIAHTIGWVQILPLIIYSLCFWLGPILSILKSITVMLWARDMMLFEFPKLVHHLQDPPPSLLQRLFHKTTPKPEELPAA